MFVKVQYSCVSFSMLEIQIMNEKAQSANKNGEKATRNKLKKVEKKWKQTHMMDFI